MSTNTWLVFILVVYTNDVLMVCWNTKCRAKLNQLKYKKPTRSTVSTRHRGSQYGITLMKAIKLMLLGLKQEHYTVLFEYFVWIVLFSINEMFLQCHQYYVTNSSPKKKIIRIWFCSTVSLSRNFAKLKLIFRSVIRTGPLGHVSGLTMVGHWGGGGGLSMGLY